MEACPAHGIVCLVTTHRNFAGMTIGVAVPGALPAALQAGLWNGIRGGHFPFVIKAGATAAENIAVRSRASARAGMRRVLERYILREAMLERLRRQFGKAGAAGPSTWNPFRPSLTPNQHVLLA